MCAYKLCSCTTARVKYKTPTAPVKMTRRIRMVSRTFGAVLTCGARCAWGWGRPACSSKPQDLAVPRGPHPRRSRRELRGAVQSQGPVQGRQGAADHVVSLPPQ
eukprot:5823038-Pyramimonas_sp.AAC.1